MHCRFGFSWIFLVSFNDSGIKSGKAVKVTNRPEIGGRYSRVREPAAKNRKIEKCDIIFSIKKKEYRNGMKKFSVHQLTRISLMTAILCLFSPISIPLGISMVPISLSTLTIFLSIIVLDKKDSLFSVLLYILIGAVGIPVFSGFSGGFTKLVGPTGGYILGYIPLVILAGWISKKSKKIVIKYLGLLLGTLTCYLTGTLWLSYSTEITIVEAFFSGVVPFIPFDLIKALIAVLVGLPVKERLARALN